MPDTHDGTLIGSFATSWQDVVPRLSGMTCVWQAITGLGRGSAPSEWPAGATHLWAWSAESWIIVRPTRGGLAVGQLIAGNRSGDGEAVVYRRYPAEVWPAGEGRISSSARRALPRDCYVVEVEGQVPLQFIDASW